MYIYIIYILYIILYIYNIFLATAFQEFNHQMCNCSSFIKLSWYVKVHVFRINTQNKCTSGKMREKLFLCSFSLPAQHEIISVLSVSGQADASPLHRKALTLPHHPSQVTLGRIPPSNQPSTLHPSHHTIVQLNSTWNGYKRIGGGAERKCVCLCYTGRVCVLRSMGWGWEGAAVQVALCQRGPRGSRVMMDHLSEGPCPVDGGIMKKWTDLNMGKDPVFFLVFTFLSSEFWLSCPS